ncbi:hypothetical protein [Latilactobacillus fragifolii]|uniref:hypothetical protein n=1 Tax=Latilactobacillus fragifolii TaxID=2814244 RepID=UPI001ABAB6E7|nr:hypothetical protein [Latilactobacillus fragifolii]
MIKLTLDEKYKKLVKAVTFLNPPRVEILINDYTVLVGGLAKAWFNDGVDYNARVKVIERIHSADGIDWIAPKYKWRLKSEKLDTQYVFTSNHEHFGFEGDIDYADRLTESEFKKLLDGTGLPFEAFERVEIDE